MAILSKLKELSVDIGENEAVTLAFERIVCLNAFKLIISLSDLSVLTI